MQIIDIGIHVGVQRNVVINETKLHSASRPLVIAKESFGRGTAIHTIVLNNWFGAGRH